MLHCTARNTEIKIVHADLWKLAPPRETPQCYSFLLALPLNFQCEHSGDFCSLWSRSLTQGRAISHYLFSRAGERHASQWVIDYVNTRHRCGIFWRLKQTERRRRPDLEQFSPENAPCGIHTGHQAWLWAVDRFSVCQGLSATASCHRPLWPADRLNVSN